MKNYAPLLPKCSICGGVCDPRETRHALCEARKKHNLPTPEIDLTPKCGCSKCRASNLQITLNKTKA